MTDALRAALDTLDWRRRTFELYDNVRSAAELDGPAAAHALWIQQRNELLATHPASAILPEERAAFRGVPVAPYDPAWRFEAAMEPAEPQEWRVETGTDGVVPFALLGTVALPGIGSLDVWRLTSYGGGLFIPMKDALAGKSGGTYGGGRYLIDTIKGAWLGEGDFAARETGTATGRPSANALVLDLNFAYNPSCAYDPEWACPLAPPGNTLSVEVPVGERMP